MISPEAIGEARTAFQEVLENTGSPETASSAQIELIRGNFDKIEERLPDISRPNSIANSLMRHKAHEAGITTHDTKADSLLVPHSTIEGVLTVGFAHTNEAFNLVLLTLVNASLSEIDDSTSYSLSLIFKHQDYSTLEEDIKLYIDDGTHAVERTLGKFNELTSLEAACIVAVLNLYLEEFDSLIAEDKRLDEKGYPNFQEFEDES